MGDIAAAMGACGRSVEELFAGGKGFKVADAVAEGSREVRGLMEQGVRADWWPQEQSEDKALNGRLGSWMDNRFWVL